VTVDPLSKYDLIEEYPKLVPGFMARIAAWRTEMNLAHTVLMD